MQVTVKYVNAPKPGSKYASIKDAQGTYYGYKAGEFNFSVGQTYDIEVGERVANGRTYFDVKSVNTGPKSNGSGTASSGDRWYMPFVSNTVAHAIAAGKIEEPLDIKAWAAAAKQAAIELEQVEDDRDIPV